MSDCDPKRPETPHAARVALAALNAGAEWNRDTVVPGEAALALRDHVASLEASCRIDAEDVRFLCDAAAELWALADRGVPDLRALLRARFGDGGIDRIARVAQRLREAERRAQGEEP